MIIHFFKNREDSRLDFHLLIDEYLDRLPNSTIITDEEQVDIQIKLPEFDYAYHYYITKRSRVSSLYRLNPNYISTNMYIVVDSMIPTFISRIILQSVGEICTRFHLEIYSERATDIHPFNMFNLISDLSKEKLSYIQNHNEYKQYQLQSSKLNDICQYQVMTPSLGEYTRNYTKAENYVVLYDKLTDEVKLGINWTIGTPAFFPPYLDYVIVQENEALQDVIPSEIFFKFVKNNLVDVKSDNVNIRIQCLGENGASRASKKVAKMKKFKVSSDNFSYLKITDLIEA